MLAERITVIFQLLQCSNTEIAGFANCSPSNISRLKSGSRKPAPSGRSVQRLAEGIYRYAEEEHMLSLLKELCETGDVPKEQMTAALISWLYADGDIHLPQPVIPERRYREEQLRKNFGERLDKIMKLLGLTNVKLAAQMNVDSSLISRYRSGIYHPNRNAGIKMRLAEILFVRAQRENCVEQLAGICAANADALSPAFLAEWLFDTTEEPAPGIAEKLLSSINAYAPERLIHTDRVEFPAVERADRYWGSKGLRQAVLRFLSAAAASGGELLLYSDEPMKWMTEKEIFFQQWAALMAACVQNRVKVRVIHNIDRHEDEMVSAITGWLPLYISGMIEPYVCQRNRNTRFHHTLFVHTGGMAGKNEETSGMKEAETMAAVFGVFPADAGELRWYDYITDSARIHSLEEGFRSMLQDASPLLKIYPAEQIAAVFEMVQKEQNIRLTIFPQSMFQDLQVLILKDAVAVLRCRPPYTVFVLTHPLLTQAISDYCVSQTGQQISDKTQIEQMLEDFAGACQNLI